ncbi:MAG: hypothetical protein P8R42_13760 [Candidatus Binatia bacterium]|nr:hypothetical protein [Candidatus Binatia bacterium]
MPRLLVLFTSLLLLHAAGCTPKADKPKLYAAESHELVMHTFGIAPDAEIHMMLPSAMEEVGGQINDAMVRLVEYWPPWKLRLDDEQGPGPGLIVIEGEFYYLDGGVQWLRALSWGGVIEMAVRGRVLGPDGEPIHYFDVDGKQTGGLFRAGGDYEQVLGWILDEFAYDIVAAIDAEEFELAPVYGFVSGAAKPLSRQENAELQKEGWLQRVEPKKEEVSSATVEERLKKLGELRASGVIESEEEYKALRVKIIGEAVAE